MKLKIRLNVAFAIGLVFFLTATANSQHLMENLGRGVVAVRQSATEVYVGWRVLGTDSSDTAFNLYRSTGGGPGVLLNGAPITGGTNYVDGGADLSQSNAYFVRPVVSSVEGAASASYTLPANAAIQQFLSVSLQRPSGGTTPDNVNYTYSPNDVSVGDVDGDGEYEIILKWDPSNAQDNSNGGYTGNVYLDAYKLNGTRLWRIDLGRNIRAGAHYTQFMVYDLDGDGKAEVACKTAPGTVDGQGQNVLLPGDNASADFRNQFGYILSGPEYLTIFNGETGAALATTSYNPPRGTVTDWGDDYGNRVDRFLAGIAYLDGHRPSLVMCRGYYTRAVLAAWDWRGGQLTQRWVFDTGHTGTASPFSAWRGQGAHSLTIGDVDGDGRDEITYGAAAIDDDGTGLYSTLLGHGDALHMSDMNPSRPGLEVWMAHEDPGSYGPNGMEFRDARTGALIFGVSGQGADIGRAVAGDIDPNYPGYEMWGTRGGLMSAGGAQVSPTHPNQINFMSWWDGDLLREILDGTTISKWNWNTNTSSSLLAPAGVSSNNGTKANPALSADILGDWREEVIFRENTNDALRIYTTTAPTSHRIYTLMHDRQYRLAIAWQNTAYNQPPHPSFFLGDGMATPPQPDIVTSLAELGTPVTAVSSINRYDPVSPSTGLTSVTFRVTFTTPVTGVDVSDFLVTTSGNVTGTVSNVAPVSSFAYNVTVSSITGTGTIRLDLKASGTGITGPGGVPISGGFTSGQTYFRATLAWINPVTGGLWSDSANWDGGVIANDIGAVPIFGNFDLTSNNTVFLDTPRTISGFVFGDTVPASSASWVISDGGNPDNVLTLDTTSGVPTGTVNALGAGATATLAVTLSGNDGFAKAGPGTLVLTKPAALTGQVNVNAGTLRFATGSSLTASTVGISAGNGLLDINGGTFTATGVTTVNGTGGSLIVNEGTGTFTAVNLNNTASGLIRVNGGTFNATSINIPRSSDATPSFGFGFVVTGGASNVAGTVGIGTNNSWGSMSVEGGSLNVSGAITIGNQTSANRGGQMRVTGGTFASTNTTDGIILGRRAANVSNATFSGGTSFVERFKLGFDSSVNSGSATLAINGGALYLGSGGLVRNGTGTFTSTINLTGGTLGAKADWATNQPLSLSGGNITLKAADFTDAPFNISLTGPLSGPGGLTKTGAGTLTLATVNTFTGVTDVNGGALRVNGSVAAGSPLNVNSDGTLAGNGSVNRAVTLNAGGTVAPGGVSPIATLNGNSLTWNGGGKMAFDLDTSSDQLALSGALNKGSAGSYQFVFNPGAGVTEGSTYTLLTFGSTNFAVQDFSYSGLPVGTLGSFRLNSGNLQFIIDNTPPVIACPPDIVVVAAPGQSSAVVNFTVTGSDNVSAVTISSQPASGSAFPLGTTTVTATATDAAGNSSTCNFTVTVKSATTTVVLPASAQYSDSATLQATVSAAPVPAQPLAGSVEFFVSGNSVGTAPVVDGVATLPLTIVSASGTYDVTAQFTSANPFYVDSAGGPATLTVNKENAATAYTGDEAIMTAGPNVNTATIRLGAHLTPEADGEGFGGDITKATVTFELFKSNNVGGTPDQVVSNVAVDTNGDALIIVDGLAAETYSINVKVDGTNAYWIANPIGIGVLNITVPTDENRSNGGGWVPDGSSSSGKAHFGFSVWAGKKPGQAKGGLTFTFSGFDGFNYIVKSNSWQDGYLQFSGEPGLNPVVYTRSNFKGKGSVQKVDPITGQVVASWGNYSFEVFTFDGDLLNPPQPDALSITVWDNNGQIWHQVGTSTSLVTLGGGNIKNKN